MGALAALAADAPEIPAAVTALTGHQARIGAGVVIGSNVFNVAALLGLSAVLAGEIALHRQVIVMEGVVALWVAAVCVAVILGLPRRWWAWSWCWVCWCPAWWFLACAAIDCDEWACRRAIALTAWMTRNCSRQDTVRAEAGAGPAVNARSLATRPRGSRRSASVMGPARRRC